MFWVTIGSNTNLHLTLIYLFSVVSVGGLLVTDEPVEVEDSRRINNHFREIHGIPQINIENTEGCQHVIGWTRKH